MMGSSAAFNLRSDERANRVMKHRPYAFTIIYLDLLELRKPAKHNLS